MLLISVLALTILNLATLLKIFKNNKIVNKLIIENSLYEERVKNLNNEINAQNQKINSLIIDNNEFRNLKGQFEGAFKQSQNELNNLIHEKQSLTNKISDMQAMIIDYEKNKERLSQNFENLEKERNEWKINKDLRLLELSEELIKKNNEYQEKSTKNNQQQIIQITNELLKNFESVFVKVKSLDDDVKKSLDISNQTKNALLNPAKAGRAAEITLENILKSSGLKEKSKIEDIGDYILQSHFIFHNDNNAEENKRPDALIFLPNDVIVIIDSKSSTQFIDLEISLRNNDIAETKLIYLKIKESMRRHLESLKKRNYKNALIQDLHLKNIDNYKIMNVMFLQTEKMLDIINEIDQEFCSKAMDEGVAILSPIGLINLLSQAKIIIERIKQQENISELKNEIQKLIDQVLLVIQDTKDIGKFLNKTFISYNKIGRRFNKNINKSIRNIHDLGISGQKTQDIDILEQNEDQENQ